MHSLVPVSSLSGSHRGDAVFSVCRTYRYQLSRCWDPSGESVCFVMLNPSTADGTTDDPTVRRCIHFARHWGFGRLDVVNLFAYRATDPDILHAKADSDDIIGPANDEWLLRATSRSKRIILAWGNYGGLLNRDTAVCRLLRQSAETEPASPLFCFGTTAKGQPRHPLYLSASATLQLYGP